MKNKNLTKSKVKPLMKPLYTDLHSQNIASGTKFISTPYVRKIVSYMHDKVK